VIIYVDVLLDCLARVISHKRMSWNLYCVDFGEVKSELIKLHFDVRVLRATASMSPHFAVSSVRRSVLINLINNACRWGLTPAGPRQTGINCFQPTRPARSQKNASVGTLPETQMHWTVTPPALDVRNFFLKFSTRQPQRRSSFAAS